MNIENFLTGLLAWFVLVVFCRGTIWRKSSPYSENEKAEAKLGKKLRKSSEKLKRLRCRVNVRLNTMTYYNEARSCAKDSRTFEKYDYLHDVAERQFLSVRKKYDRVYVRCEKLKEALAPAPMPAVFLPHARRHTLVFK